VSWAPEKGPGLHLGVLQHSEEAFIAPAGGPSVSNVSDQGENTFREDKVGRIRERVFPWFCSPEGSSGPGGGEEKSESQVRVESDFLSLKIF